MKLEQREVPEFDLARTLESGQVFHWSLGDDGCWTGLIDRRLVKVRQLGKTLEVPHGSFDLITNYFALDHPLSKIYRAFPRDPYVLAARKACRGMRIIRQPLWECLATFLFSSMKQVAHIRKISRTLRERYGQEIDGSGHFTFPVPAVLASVPEKELRACGLGYRAAHLRQTAERVADGGFPLAEVPSLSTDSAREALCSLPGIGPKIANCVLLFALGRLDAVPVDVWIHRILSLMEADEKSIKPEKRHHRAVDVSRLGTYAGYVQQYLFHYARVERVLPGNA